MHGRIITASGKLIDPLNLRAEDIEISDIAHALSQICRWGGHTIPFYSVAQHSIRVARLLPAELQLCGLLHDATEAYICDLPRPIKALMPEYQRAEKRCWQAIATRYGLPLEIPDLVNFADNALLLCEAGEYTSLTPDYLAEVDPGPYNAVQLEMPLKPTFASQMFLSVFTELLIRTVARDPNQAMTRQ